MARNIVRMKAIMKVSDLPFEPPVVAGEAVEMGERSVEHDLIDALRIGIPQAGRHGAAAFDDLIRTLQQALGLTVFLITHDLDTLYTICDRVAVLADRRVLINAPLAEVEKFDHPWVQEYFHGPRGRAAQTAQEKQ